MQGIKEPILITEARDVVRRLVEAAKEKEQVLGSWTAENHEALGTNDAMQIMQQYDKALPQLREEFAMMLSANDHLNELHEVWQSRMHAPELYDEADMAEARKNFVAALDSSQKNLFKAMDIAQRQERGALLMGLIASSKLRCGMTFKEAEKVQNKTRVSVPVNDSEQDLARPVLHLLNHTDNFTARFGQHCMQKEVMGGVYDVIAELDIGHQQRLCDAANRILGLQEDDRIVPDDLRGEKEGPNDKLRLAINAHYTGEQLKVQAFMRELSQAMGQDFPLEISGRFTIRCDRETWQLARTPIAIDDPSYPQPNIDAITPYYERALTRLSAQLQSPERWQRKTLARSANMPGGVAYSCAEERLSSDDIVFPVAQRMIMLSGKDKAVRMCYKLDGAYVSQGEYEQAPQGSVKSREVMFTGPRGASLLKDYLGVDVAKIKDAPSQGRANA